MMKDKQKTARRIVAQAIMDTGTYDLADVINYLVEHYYNMVSIRPRVQRDEVWNEVFKQLSRIGIETTEDVRRLIDETMRRQAG
jgi:predicted CoA-binding protein